MSLTHVQCHPKLLTHRLRGFAAREHSLCGLRVACALRVPFIEIDIRCCSDGKWVVWHDPFILERGFPRFLKTLSYNEMKRLRPWAFSLTEFVNVFLEESTHSTLCIDIKDVASVEKVLNSLPAIGDRLTIISWSEETIYECAQKMQAAAPRLFFSYLDVRRYGMKMPKSLSIRLLWLLIQHEGTEPRVMRAQGFQHASITSRISEKLALVLRETGGGIIVPRWSLCPALKEEAQRRDLRLWTFSAKGVKDFYSLARDEAIDVVFHDDAKRIMGDVA